MVFESSVSCSGVAVFLSIYIDVWLHPAGAKVTKLEPVHERGLEQRCLRDSVEKHVEAATHHTHTSAPTQNHGQAFSPAYLVLFLLFLSCVPCSPPVPCFFFRLFLIAGLA